MNTRGILKIFITSSTCIVCFMTIKKFLEWMKTLPVTKYKVRMKGIGIKSYSGLEAIRILEDLPLREPEKANDVLLCVKSCAIDPIDFKVMTGYNRNLRQSLSKFNKVYCDEFPLILGRDCTGIVIATGRDVTEFQPGDEVWAVSPTCHQGFMSQFVTTTKDCVERKPKNLTFDEASVLPYPAILVWNALVNNAKLGPQSTKDKRVFIYDGSSEVGCLAIQLVKSWGGHVTTTVKKAALINVMKLGVNDVVVHDIDDFVQEIHKREKFDVIFNPLGSTLHQMCKEICKRDGIIVSMVASPSAREKFGIVLGPLYSLFSFLRSLFNQRIVCGNDIWWSTTEISSFSLREICTLVETQQIRPVLDSVWDLERYAEAFEQAAGSHITGRVVIRINS